MRILFVGESWLGSCARSLKEGLARNPEVVLDEVNEDLHLPKPRARWLRAVNRLLADAYREELFQQIFAKVKVFKPDVVMVYKGFSIDKEVIDRLRGIVPLVVNVYPDYSPHAYGLSHREAVGAYDLVISTKVFHPDLWSDTYGYSNRCVFVPQGYDPALHLADAYPSTTRFDVTMVATWRAEYSQMMSELGRVLGGKGISFGIGGNGWAAHKADFPSDWEFGGEMQGRSYVEWLRQGKICIAPVTRSVLINGKAQPGDEDTTRTYELAAAHCFFIHRRTPLAQQLYDESTEVPMYDTVEELAEKITHHLSNPDVRQKMACSAHRRAVPAYSVDARAAQIVSILSSADFSRHGK